MTRQSHEKFRVFGNVFDEHSNRNIYKLITEGYFDGMGSPVSVGKEANIFVGEKKEGKPVIVKIYRLQSCNFNKMYDYIKGDPRYLHLKKKRREIIFAWTQREYRNLMKAREAGVKVPTPLTFKDNIIVMEFIGDEDPSSRLSKEIPSTKAGLKKFYEKTVDYMRKLHKAGLVHGDLSPFNILNYNGEPVFIDFSQSTTILHPNSIDYIRRDARNVSNFFIKHGIKTSEEEIYRKVVK